MRSCRVGGVGGSGSASRACASLMASSITSQDVRSQRTPPNGGDLRATRIVREPSAAHDVEPFASQLHDAPPSCSGRCGRFPTDGAWCPSGDSRGGSGTRRRPTTGASSSSPDLADRRWWVFAVASQTLPGWRPRGWRRRASAGLLCGAFDILEGCDRDHHDAALAGVCPRFFSRTDSARTSSLLHVARLVPGYSSPASTWSSSAWGSANRSSRYAIRSLIRFKLSGSIRSSRPATTCDRKERTSLSPTIAYT